MTLARDKKTIYDGKLPRVAMCLSQLKQLHARMLRSFAECPDFDHTRLNVRVRTVERKKKQLEFESLQLFLDHHNHKEVLPTNLELSYSYSSVGTYNGVTDVALMDVKLNFGENGFNDVYIASNDHEWVDRTHQTIQSKLSTCSVFRSANFIKAVSFTTAMLCLMAFGSAMVPFASVEMGLLAVVFLLSMLITAIPNDAAPFKRMSSNRIFFS